MVQLEGCSLDQRKTILNIFEEKGEITDKELSEVMGTEAGGLFDMRTTLLDSQYKASLMGQTLQEFTAEAKAHDQSRLTQYALFVAAPMLLNYQIGSYSPSPSNASLNPSVRLDQIEIESQSGLKTYDYVPITPESLDKAAGGAKTAGKDVKFGSSTKSAQKVNNQMVKRGWTEDVVRNTVDKPYTTRTSVNKATGNPATVYYTKKGSYVIVDNVTKTIVQISDNINPSTWAPDTSIVNPYIPK